MNRAALLIFFMQIIGFSMFGQNNIVSEFDLYGCWAVERIEKREYTGTMSYLSCEKVDPDKKIKGFSFKLSAFGQSTFEKYCELSCFSICSMDGNWTYDNQTKILTILYPKDYKQEVWEAIKKEMPEIEVPDQMIYLKFEVSDLKDGILSLIKIPNNNLELAKN